MASIKQSHNESIRAYLDRFNEDAMKVHTLTPDVAGHPLGTGLRASLFKMELAKDNVDSMDDLHFMDQQFINMEETINTQPTIDYQPQNPSCEAKKPHPMAP
ncbi:hypothetical protein Lal_00021112 [Lupinus albus]|nr:hypothetical protein Lal_00021112 [Lupinus albus]